MPNCSNCREYAIEKILTPPIMDFSQIDKGFAERLKQMFLAAAEKNRGAWRLRDDELEQAAAAGPGDWPCRRFQLPDTEDEKS